MSASSRSEWGFEFLKVEDLSPVGEGRGGKSLLVTITRPSAMNALNATLMKELGALIDAIGGDRDCRGLILTGDGPKAFVAGADISEFQNLSPEAALELAQAGQDVFRRLEELPFCTIAAVNGFALGGGFELALSCDFILASDSARLGLPEVGLGLIPGYGGTQRLAQAVGAQLAKRIIFSGEMFPSLLLKEWGVVTEVVPSERLLPRAKEILNVVSQKSPQAIALAKVAIHAAAGDKAKGFSVEAGSFSEAFRGADRQEGVGAFLGKRKPVFGPRNA